MPSFAFISAATRARASRLTALALGQAFLDLHILVVVFAERHLTALDAGGAGDVDAVLAFFLTDGLHRNVKRAFNLVDADSDVPFEARFQAGLAGQVLDLDDGLVMGDVAVPPHLVAGQRRDTLDHTVQRLIRIGVDLDRGFQARLHFLHHGFMDVDLHLHLFEVGDAKDRLLAEDHGAGADLALLIPVALVVDEDAVGRGLQDAVIELLLEPVERRFLQLGRDVGRFEVALGLGDTGHARAFGADEVALGVDRLGGQLDFLSFLGEFLEHHALGFLAAQEIPLLSSSSSLSAVAQACRSPS